MHLLAPPLPTGLSRNPIFSSVNAESPLACAKLRILTDNTTCHKTSAIASFAHAQSTRVSGTIQRFATFLQRQLPERQAHAH